MFCHANKYIYIYNTGLGKKVKYKMTSVLKKNIFIDEKPE